MGLIVVVVIIYIGYHILKSANSSPGAQEQKDSTEDKAMQLRREEYESARKQQDAPNRQDGHQTIAPTAVEVQRRLRESFELQQQRAAALEQIRQEQRKRELHSSKNEPGQPVAERQQTAMQQQEAAQLQEGQQETARLQEATQQQEQGWQEAARRQEDTQRQEILRMQEAIKRQEQEWQEAVRRQEQPWQEQQERERMARAEAEEWRNKTQAQEGEAAAAARESQTKTVSDYYSMYGASLSTDAAAPQTNAPPAPFYPHPPIRKRHIPNRQKTLNTGCFTANKDRRAAKQP